MGYDSTTKVITSPVDTTDVSAALGVSSNDFGVLCSSKKVNPDALFRPYETGAFKYDHELFKKGGEDGLYGYDIPMTQNDTARDLWMKTWADKGRPTAHFRTIMFDGYDHKASFDAYPFGITITKAGSAFVVEYKSSNDMKGQVNPALMEGLKDYYPAFQIFEQGVPSTVPSELPVFNWCGANKVSEGASGEYLYDMNLEDGKTYFIIPFLSQNRFETKGGYIGTIGGKKYCLIYKNWTLLDWTISSGEVDITEYTVHIGFSPESSYTVNATFSYEFFVSLYIVPTYWFEVYNALGQKVYEETDFKNVADGFTGEAGKKYEFGKSISIVGTDGQPWPSGYTVRVHHKEQSSADGTNKEFYEDYIIP